MATSARTVSNTVLLEQVAATRTHRKARGDREARERQLQRMILLGTLVLIPAAALASLTGWRWKPWPAGPNGYESMLREARSAAESYVPLGFNGL